MSFWIFAPVIGLMALALRTNAPTARRYTWAFVIIVCVLAYEASSMHAV